MMLTKENTHRLIPHRYPFLLVDKVVEYEKGHWIKGIKRISRNDRLHLTYSPVLLCESLAQLSKMLESLSENVPEEISYLTGLQIDFFEPVYPGDEIELYARKEREFKQMVSYYVEAQTQDKKLLKGTLLRRQNVR